MKKILSFIGLLLLSAVLPCDMAQAADVSNITVGTWNVGHFVAGANRDGYDGDNASTKVVQWKNFVSSKRPDILCVEEWDYQDYFDKARSIKASDNILLPTYTSTTKNWLYQPVGSKWIMNGIFTNFTVNTGSRATTLLGDEVYYIMSETITIDGHDLTVICGHIPYTTDYHANALTLVKNELRKHKTFIFMADTNSSTAEQLTFLTEEGYHLANLVNNNWLKTTADNHSYDNIITSPDITISSATAAPSGLYDGDHYPLFCNLKIEWDSNVTQGGLVYKLDTTNHTATVIKTTGDMPPSLTIPASITVSGTTYSVTRIGMNAFYQNTTLTAVDIPASVTKIESHAFQECTSLATVTFHEGTDLQMSRRSFFKCTALTTLSLPACYSDNFITDGEYEAQDCVATFTNCSALTKVTFASGSKLKKTYNYMFQNCTKLANINLEACTSLTNIAGWAFQADALTSIKLPASLVTLEQKCFQNCTSLASVDLTACADLTTIGEYAFYANIFPTIDLSASAVLESFGQYCFTNNAQLETVVLPSSLTSLGDCCFQNDKKLSNINIEACTRLTTIPNRAFQNCNALTSVDLTNCTELTLIHTNAFQNCDLRTINLSKCTKIGTLREWAFAGNKKLKTVILPKSLKMIYGDTFYGNTSLENVVYQNEAFDWTQTASVVLNKPTAFSNMGTRTVRAFYFADCTNVPDNMNNGTVTVTMVPVTPMEIGADSEGYATYYTAVSAFDLPSDLEVSIAPSVSNGTISLEAVEGTLPAATAVLIKGTTGKHYPVIRPDITTAAPTNLLHGSDTETTTTGGDKYYKLAYGSDESGHADRLAWYWGAENGGAFTIAANKAWLALSDEQAQNARYITFTDDDPTGINNVEREPVTNGRNDMYDLQGRKVREQKPGLYIVNGRKVIVTQ